jgi:ubiquinone/menaquinone biosynthesis C-methylase UbiE
MVELDRSERKDYDTSSGKWRNIPLHVNWLDNLLKKYNVKNILSLGCGTGTYEILLAKKGYSVFGMDYNPHFIKRAKLKAKKEKVKITFKVGDIRNFSYGKFDAVLSIWAPIMFGCKNINQVTDALKCIKNSMTKESIALFETGTPSLLNTLSKIKNPNTKYTFDNKKNKCYVEEFNKGEKTTATYNLYTKEEFTKIFDRLGLRPIRWYGPFNHKTGKYTQFSNSSDLITALFKLK